MWRLVSAGGKPGPQRAATRCPGQRPPAQDRAGRRYRPGSWAPRPGPRAARDRVSAYYRAQLAEPLSHVAAATGRYRDGQAGARTVDETIHHHRAATKLWKMCSSHADTECAWGADSGVDGRTSIAVTTR